MSLDPRYPIGKFSRPATINPALCEEWLSDLEQFPALMRNAVTGLSEQELDTPYREGGWTIRQVVHHVADSHMHSYIRCKFALSMNNPTIMPYDEAIWAEYVDGAGAPVELSLRLLESLHARWTMWLRSLGEGELERTIMHPENGPMTVAGVMALYSWHGRHHLQQVLNATGRS